MCNHKTSLKDSRNNKGKVTKISHILKVATGIKSFSKDTIQKLAFRLQIQPNILASKVEKARKEGGYYAK